jgi:lipopolysaccharide export system protein LptA
MATPVSLPAEDHIGKRVFVTFVREGPLKTPLWRCLFAIAAALLATATRARASELPSRVDIRADRIAFYPYQNQTLLAAEGHVTIREGSRTLSADSMRYDIINNKLLLTGNVHVANRKRDLDAAAYALDLKSGSAEVLKLDDVPATYAVHDDDEASAVEGAPPKDAFAQLDIDGVRPYIKSRHAIVTPGAGLRMTPADFPTPAGPSMRLPTFLYTIVQNTNITRSSLPGSTFDQPLNLTTSPGSLLAAHLRYDSTYGPTLGFDERLVDNNKSYFVASVLPLRDKQIDAIGFESIRPGLQQTINVEHTIGLYPFTSISYKLQDTGRYTTQTFQTDLNNADNDLGFNVSTIQHDVGHLFTYQLNTGYSYNHNYEAYPVANDFRKTIGGYAYLPTQHFMGTTFDEEYNYTYTAYDYPHQLSDGTLTLKTGHRYKNIQLTGTVSFEQTDDRFRSPAVAMEALGLPDPTTDYHAPDGTYYPGFFAFAGLSTYRTYSGSATFNGRGDNRVVFTLTHTDDFPQFHGYGRPPLTATLDVTRRISQLLRVEVSRSYTFGWDRLYLSPQYYFAVSQ